MANSTCPKCGIRERGAQSYCRECFRAYKRDRQAAKIAASPERSCSECATSFRSPYAHTLTCSAGCGANREWRLRGTQIKIATIPPRACPECGAEFLAKNTTAKFCSPRCKATDRNRRRKGQRVRASRGLESRIGPEACAEFRETKRASALAVAHAAKARWALANHDRRKATSRAWSEINVARRNELTRRYRANKRAAFTVPFTPEHLEGKLAYWGGLCWMCGKPANSVDHVKPLIKNGPHILSNFRPACGSCNSAKGGRWFGVSGLNRFIKN